MRTNGNLDAYFAGSDGTLEGNGQGHAHQRPRSIRETRKTPALPQPHDEQNAGHTQKDALRHNVLGGSGGSRSGDARRGGRQSHVEQLEARPKTADIFLMKPLSRGR
jgi:hypothetical protein